MSGEVSETTIIYRLRLTQRGNLGVEFLERQFQLHAVAVEQHIGIEAVQAERLAELVVRDLVLAVQIDQVRFLRHLREVDAGSAKPFLDVLGKLQAQGDFILA